MDPPHAQLKRIKSIQEFHEQDRDQGVDRTYRYYKTGSHHYHTHKQDVDILESNVWGKMLFLDKTLQSTTRDEVMYHTTLVHPLLDCLKDRSRILILGGGEGATAREVLRWSAVKDVTMVDYDKDFVEIMRKTEYGYAWSRGAFNDRRLNLVFDDAWKYMQTIPKYDGVIIDLTDPDLDKQDWSGLLKMVMASVSCNKGGFVMNAGLYLPWSTYKLVQIKGLIEDLCKLNRGYKYYVYTTFIPSFNGEWTFFAVAHQSSFMKEPSHVPAIPEWIQRATRVLESYLIDMPADTVPDVTAL